VLLYNETAKRYEIVVLSTTTPFSLIADVVLSGTTAQVPEAHTSQNSPNMCYDFAAGQFVIVQARVTNGGKLRLQRFAYNNATNVITWGATAIDSTLVYQSNIGFCLYGSFDFGSPHLLYGSYGTAATLALDATGAADNQFSWPHGSTNVRRGMVWTGTTTPFTTGQFQMFDSAGLRYNYETGAGNRWTAAGDTTWYAAYSATNGAAETTLSKIATFTMSKRARVKFTLAALPSWSHRI
jgi:hypothetical protein